MNMISVWLPPDGDAKLAAFQLQLTALAGLPGPSLPAHLELSSGFPVGPVVAGAWRLEREPVWDARDDRGPVGVFRFGLGDRSWAEEDLEALPPAPGWRWTKGVTARLHWDLPLEDSTFILWFWSSRRGWRADLPRR